MNKTERHDMIGYNRFVRLSWLEHTAELVAAGLKQDEIAEALETMLKDQLSVGSDAERSSRSKTITLLLKTWVRVDPKLSSFRDRGIALFQATPRDQHLILHWGMSVATYPFLGAVAEIAGRLLRLQGQVAASQVQRRIREAHGERETVARSARYVLRSLIEWKVLSESAAKGIYIQNTKIDISDMRIASWIIEAVIRCGPSTIVPLRAVMASPVLFPFVLPALRSDVLSANNSIDVIRHGADEDLVAVNVSAVGQPRLMA